MATVTTTVTQPATPTVSSAALAVETVAVSFPTTPTVTISASATPEVSVAALSIHTISITAD